MNEADAFKTYLNMTSGYLTQRALYVVASLKIADHLVEKPCSASTLAGRVNVDSDVLNRILRLLTSQNVFVCDEQGLYQLNDLSQYLVSTHKHSLCDFFCQEDPCRWNSYGHLEEGVRSGISSFECSYKDDYFSFLQKHPELFARFSQGVSVFARVEESIVMHEYPFEGFNNIIDVGGGQGSLLSKILLSNKKSHGVLFDSTQMLGDGSLFTQNNLTDRCTFVEGSFFDDNVPENGDLYILKRILHDWPDDKCLTLLKNIHQAMPTHAKLLVVDFIVSNDPQDAIVNELDLIMFCLLNRKERTIAEFSDLFERSGFKISSVSKTDAMVSLIELVKS